jgi:hypothetical protein
MLPEFKGQKKEQLIYQINIAHYAGIICCPKNFNSEIFQYMPARTEK